ncbi:RraA family protein [Enterovirga sp. CN4-39]|uniref:RraA family protein n=1 Tax=Enterovirga sp. CN4-39 TaxID=3400910 RepID=UPI003C0F51A8
MLPVDVQKRLYAAVLSDVLDGMGFRSQAMRPFVRPLDEAHILFGRARTGLYMPVYSVREGENPYDVEIALVDDLKEGDVAVFACGGPTDRIAPWGELLTTAARARGAAGCVTDGLVRDIRAIRATGFPVFHGGIGPLDSKGRGKMMEADVPVECGGVLVHPGDWVFGDADGVVIIPASAASEAFATALAKVDSETTTRDELAVGAKLADVFRRHGVL